jgi:hypothetical protein
MHRPERLGEGEQAKDGGVYLMYHGTRPEVAALIEQGGFKASTQGLLGPGVYVGRTAEGCRKYGSTILEVMVRVGRVCRADEHPELIPRGYGKDAPWHDKGGYDTAWVPPDCPASVFDEAELFEAVTEEGCVWDSGCVKVLGRAADDDNERMQTTEWSFEQGSEEIGGDGGIESATGWVAFARSESLAIESHYRAWQSRDGDANVVVKFGDGAKTLFGRSAVNRLRLSFDRMVERGVRTGDERRIRRGLTRRGAAALLQAMVRQIVTSSWEVMHARLVATLVLQKTYRGHLCRRSLR